MGVQIQRKQQEIVWNKIFRVAYPNRTRSVESLLTWTLARRASARIVSSLAILVHRLHPLHHHVSLMDGFRSCIRLVFQDMVAGEEEGR